MKKIILTLLLASLCLFCNAQFVTPNELCYHYLNRLCLKKTYKRYNGEVKGLASVRKHKIAKIREIIPKLHTISPEGVGEYFYVEELIVYGNVKNGKEEGRWQYFLNDSTLFFEANFVNGKFDGFFIRYDLPKRKIIDYYRKGKEDDIYIVLDEDEKIIDKKLFAD